MLACLGYSIRSYPKGDMVWNVGTHIESFGIVLEGQAQVVREDYFGKTQHDCGNPAGRNIWRGVCMRGNQGKSCSGGSRTGYARAFFEC